MQNHANGHVSICDIVVGRCGLSFADRWENAFVCGVHSLWTTDKLIQNTPWQSSILLFISCYNTGLGNNYLAEWRWWFMVSCVPCAPERDMKFNDAQIDNTHTHRQTRMQIRMCDSILWGRNNGAASSLTCTECVWARNPRVQHQTKPDQRDVDMYVCCMYSLATNALLAYKWNMTICSRPKWCPFRLILFQCSVCSQQHCRHIHIAYIHAGKLDAKSITKCSDMCVVCVCSVHNPAYPFGYYNGLIIGPQPYLLCLSPVSRWSGIWLGLTSKYASV